MSKNMNDINAISAELKRGNREIQESQKLLDGWADRVIKAFHINEYADYPKRPKAGDF